MNHTTLKALVLSLLLLCGQAMADPAVEGLTISHDSAQPGQTVMGTIFLNAPAPAEGMQVELWSGREASTPTYVFVAAGQRSANFPIEVNDAAASEVKVAALQPAASAIGSFQITASPVLSSR